MELDDVVRYGICKQNVIVQLIQKTSDLEANTLFLGTLVRIVQQIDHKYIAIQVCDWELRATIWKNTVWYCPIEYIVPVDSDIWEFLPAIISPLDRVHLVQNDDICNFLKILRTGLIIAILQNDKLMKCIVKYVGPVKTMGPGYYIGVELLGEFNQQGNCDGTYGYTRYFTCQENAGLFITAADIIIDDNDLPDSEKDDESIVIDNIIDISSKKPTFNTKLKILDPQNLKQTFNNSINIHKNGSHDDKIKLLAEWPQNNLSDTPVQMLYKSQQQNNIQTKSQNNTNNTSSTMNRKNSTELKQNTKKDANHLYSSEFYPSNHFTSPDTQTQSHHQQPSPHRECDEVDLIEILQGEWPAEAGDTIVSALNNSTSVAARISEYERNKSINPISHLIQPKKKTNRYGSSSLSTSHTTNHTNSITDTKSNETSHNKKKLNLDPPISKLSQSSGASTNVPIYDTPERSHSPTSPAAQNDKYSNNNLNNDLSDNYDLGIGSLVEVNTDVSDPIYGVIRWISAHTPRVVGVELEEEQTHLPIDLTDGTYNGQRYFTCTPGKGLFVPIEQCQVDQRFQELETQNERHHIDKHNGPKDVSDPTMFGQMECPVIEGAVPPLCMQTEAQVEDMCGKYRGIQGHHNSCYLDATLFAMFACTAVFDSLLFRPPSRNDIERYEEVQKVLREEIVNPLRQNLYVRADRVMKLRTLLEQLSSVTGLTSEEKDPEEFLNSLLAQILRAEPFLKLSSGQEAFYYQLFVEKNERLTLPSVQQLFEQSFLASNIKLKEVPSCLIIQMPRFGKSYKMYPRIIPSQVLDVTDIIEDSPRQCTVCGNLAEYECLQCFDPCGEGLEGTAFCAPCRELTHGDSTGRSNHRPTILHVPADFRIMAEHCPSPPRLYMELFAVVCIETSHYVSFVKCGSGHDAPWCFFDSMADRKGEQNGYNIPEIVACPGLASWLGEDAGSSPPRAPQLPEPARRLLCDAYLCLYQSSDVMMYR